MIDPRVMLAPGLPLAVLDVEATGLDDDDRICEVAIIHAELGTPGGRLACSSRVKAPVPMGARASRITGIADADLVDSPTWAEGVGDAVAKACEGRLMVAYNAPFDHKMLCREGLDLGWPWLDPFVMVKVVDKYERGKTLAAVAERRGVVVDAHGAAGDALATALITDSLLRQSWDMGARWSTVGELLSAIEHDALEQEAEFCAYLAGKGARGDRPGCPWHEMRDMELPYWPDEAPMGTCLDCRGPVRWSVSQGGVAVRLNEDGARHRCGAA